MFKMTREIYEKRMSKLFEGRPVQYCTIRITKKTLPTTAKDVVNITKVPCIITQNRPVITSNFSPSTNSNTYTRSMSFTYEIEKKYLENKVFGDGIPLKIELMLIPPDLGGYYLTEIVPRSSSTIDEEGYGNIDYSDCKVLFGDYIDGSYRETIEFITYKVTTYTAV